MVMKAPNGLLFRHIGVVLTAISVLALATPAVPERGAGVEWEILNKEALRLWRAGEYDRAVIVAKKALEVAEKDAGAYHPHVATSLNILGLLYDNQGKYALAEPFFRRSLAIHEKALGSEHPNVAIDQLSLAALYHNQGKYALAEPLMKSALDIFEKSLGLNHPHIVTTLDWLAFLYRATQRDSEAEKLEQRAARIRAIER